MGRETGRLSINRVSPAGLLATLLLFLVPAGAFSADKPDDYVQWFEALKNGTPDEKTYALSYTPASFDCCKLQKDPGALNLFLKALKDKNHRVREAAAASVRDLGTFSASCCRETQLVPALIETLKDIHPHVREEVVRTLAFLKDERSVDTLISKTGDEDPWVRLNVAFALGEMGGVKAVDPLLKMLEEESDWRNKFVQQEALIAIRKIADPNKKGIPTIIKKFHDPYLKAEVIKFLGTFRVEGAKDLLIEASHDSNERIRKLAIEALSRLSLPGRAGRAGGPAPGREAEPRDVEVFMKGLKDPSAEVRARSAETLGRLEENRAVDPLIEVLSDPDGMVRNQAIAALAHFQDERILDVLINFQMKGRGFYPPDALERTFDSVTSKMSKERVYVYRKEGVRQVSRTSIEIPKGEKYDELRVHPVAVSKLINALSSGDSAVRTRALEMIDSFEDDRIEGNLIECLKDPSPRRRQKAISLLRIYGSDKVVPMLMEALKDRERGVREASANTLGAFKDKRSFEPLLTGLSDGDDGVRVAALRSLGNFDSEKVLNINIELLKDGSASMRRVAVSYVKRKPDKRAVEPLINLLGDQDVVIAGEATETLGLLGDTRAIGPLTDVLEGKYDRHRGLWEEEVRKKAATALGAIGDKEALPALIRALDDKEVKLSAIPSVGSMKDRSAVPALIKCLSDENLHVRRQAAAALRQIGDPAGLEAVKQYPAETIIHMGSGAPVVSRVLKSAPGPPKDPSHRAGYDPILFGNQKQTTEKQPPPPEVKATPPQTPPPARTEKIPRLEPPPRPDIKPLIARLRTDDPRTRRQAADLLGDAGNKEATDSLIPLLRDRDDCVRQAAARALGKLRDKRAVEPLLRVVRDEGANRELRKEAAYALGLLGDRRAVDPLINILNDKKEDRWLRVAAAASLGNIGDEKAMGPLQETQEDSYVQNACQGALQKIRTK